MTDLSRDVKSRRARPGRLVSPIRMCVGCRGRAAQSELVRAVVVSRGGRLAVVCDTSRRLPGRGAWVHPKRRCVECAERRSALRRALRIDCQVDLAEFFSTIDATDEMNELPSSGLLFEPGENHGVANLAALRATESGSER